VEVHRGPDVVMTANARLLVDAYR